MIEEKINQLIEPSLNELGFEVVRTKLIDQSKKKTLQIFIDKIDGTGITVGDCSKASKQVSAILDVEDPIESKYNLEVSSPGIDRPLSKLSHFQKYVGEPVKITTKDDINDRRNFKGTISKVDENNKVIYIHINVVELNDPEKKDEIEITLENVQNATLLASEKLFN